MKDLGLLYLGKGNHRYNNFLHRVLEKVCIYLKGYYLGIHYTKKKDYQNHKSMVLKTETC